MATVRYTVADGEVLSELRSGTKRDYVPDPLGSTVALLDNTQTKTDTFAYWPYGEVASRTGTTATPFQFVGKRGYYRDSASRTYVRARYLLTQLTRWMTQDPIGFKGLDYNLYRYVLNPPVQITDPNGLGWEPPTWGLGDTWAVIRACGASLYGLLQQFLEKGTIPGFQELCQAKTCLTEILSILAKAGLAVIFPGLTVPGVGTAIMGCLSNMIGSIAGSLISIFLCTKPPACGESWNVPCQIASAVGNAVASCVNGAFEGLPGIESLKGQLLDFMYKLLQTHFGNQLTGFGCEHIKTPNTAPKAAFA